MTVDKAKKKKGPARKGRRPRRRPPGSKVIPVPCGKSTHHVLVTPGGAIALLDHSPRAIARELPAAALGGAAPGCVHCLWAWRHGMSGGSAAHVPPALRREHPLATLGSGSPAVRTIRLTGWRLFRRLWRKSPGGAPVMAPDETAQRTTAPLLYARLRAARLLKRLGIRPAAVGRPGAAEMWSIAHRGRHYDWHIMLPSHDDPTVTDARVTVGYPHDRSRHYGTRGKVMRLEVGAGSYRCRIDVATSVKAETLDWLSEEAVRLALGYRGAVAERARRRQVREARALAEGLAAAQKEAADPQAAARAAYSTTPAGTSGALLEATLTVQLPARPAAARAVVDAVERARRHLTRVADLATRIRDGVCH